MSLYNSTIIHQVLLILQSSCSQNLQYFLALSPTETEDGDRGSSLLSASASWDEINILQTWDWNAEI